MIESVPIRTKTLKMLENDMKNKNSTLKTAIACIAIGWMCWSAANFCQAQTQPANPSSVSPDLQEVIKLSQAKMPDDVIKNYISSAGKSYRLSADDIVYLNSQGVSPGVISALQTASSANTSPPPVTAPPPAPPMTRSSTPTAPPVGVNTPPPDNGTVPSDDTATQPPTQEVNFDYFHDQLAPFGTWVNVGGTMYWHPDQAITANPDWRPYYDMGQWVETDNGLFWQSDYTWGDIPFHYGRWVLDPVRGWLWAPDYTWGPAWVFWRHAEADTSIGWAPLPIGAVFVGGALMFNGVAVTADFDFGLGDSFFVFVGYDHFHEGFFRMRDHEYRFNVPRERVHEFYGRSVIRNDFRRDEHGMFVNNGIGRDRIERLTHVEHANFEERKPVGNRDLLAKQRAEEPHGQTVGKPGEQRLGQTGAKPGEQRPGQPVARSGEQRSGQAVARSGGQPPTPAPVNKVFRPPTPTSKPAPAAPQKQAQAPQQKQPQKK